MIKKIKKKNYGKGSGKVVPKYNRKSGKIW